MLASTPLKISIITLTRNSEQTLEKTLSAVHQWADEIIIVDSGSTDSTIKIAEKYDCRIFHKDFTGFGEQKNFAVEKAANDWVFIVDSDEVVTDELKNEISSTMIQSGHKGFEVPITFVFQNRKFNYGKECRMYHLRLFDRTSGKYNDAKVHEDVILNGSAGRLKGEMLHYSYSDLHNYFYKFNEYTTLGANDLYKKGKQAGVAGIVFRFPVQFIQSYILHLNFLNGYPGFLWSMCSSFYPVIKYAKLKELREKK